REPFLDLLLRHRRVAEAAHEGAVGRVRFLEHRLRGGAEQLGSAVEPVELDEDRARLLGAAPAHRREGALAVATPHIGGDPDRGLEAHRVAPSDRGAGAHLATTDSDSGWTIPAAGR